MSQHLGNHLPTKPTKYNDIECDINQYYRLLAVIIWDVIIGCGTLISMP